MALTLPNRTETFEVVSRLDDSLDMNEEEFAKYLEAYDKSVLKFFPGKLPVIFVMRKVLNYGQQNMVNSAQRKVVKGEVQFDFSSTNVEVKASLTDILNGGDALKFTKDSDGSASEKLMEILMSSGIADELFVARKTVCKDATGTLRKK